MAGISNEIAALDFDLACTLRVQIFDVECKKAEAKQIAYEVSKIFGDGDTGGQTFEDGDADVW